MKHSKIKTVKIKDFRCLKEITLDFTKSPIISLIGDNESGKTSIVKSFAVLGCNADPRYQKEYIRDGTKGFGIAWELEDGTVIKRIKTDTKNIISILQGGQVYNTDKIDAGLPPQLLQTAGLLEEPETKELLQVRNYEDNLLFINTKSSENYKIMYNALKVDNLSRALSNGIKESNVIKATIQELENGLSTLQETIRSIRVVDLSTLIKVRDKVKLNLSVTTKLKKLLEYKANIERIERGLSLENELASMSEIKVESLSLFDKLMIRVEELCEIQKRYSAVSSVEAIKEIDFTDSVKLKALVDKLSSLKSMEVEFMKYDNLAKTSELNTWNLSKLEGLSDKIDKYNQYKQKIESNSLITRINGIDLSYLSSLNYLLDLDKKVKELRQQCENYKDTSDKYYHLIKESGVCVADCPNCGSTVIVERGSN